LGHASKKLGAYFYASGGYLGVKPKISTLKLTFPNGGETFVAGNDTNVTWDGIAPTDTVSLKYSTDNGVNWQMVCGNAADLTYLWKNIPFESVKLRRRFETDTSAECKTNDRWQPVTILGHHLEDNVLLYKVRHTSGSIESNVSESCLRHINKKVNKNEITETEIKEKIKEAIDKDDVETSLKWSKVLKNMKIN